MPMRAPWEHSTQGSGADVDSAAQISDSRGRQVALIRMPGGRICVVVPSGIAYPTADDLAGALRRITAHPGQQLTTEETAA